MEDLCDFFGNLAVEGSTYSRRNPYLTEGDPMPGSIVSKKPLTPEEQASLRWALFPEYEKDILETRTGKKYEWADMITALDGCMNRWFSDKCHLQKQLFDADRSLGGKASHARSQRTGLTRTKLATCDKISMAVSSYYAATLLVPDRGNIQKGLLYTFPVIHFENSLKAKWSNTHIEIVEYWCSFIVATALYIVDGQNLVCVNLAKGKTQYSVDILQKHLIDLRKSTSICANSEGLIAICTPQGVTVLYENGVNQTIDLIKLITPEEDLKYTCMGMDALRLLLGRTDSQLEAWQFFNSEKDVSLIDLSKIDTWNQFTQQKSDHSGKIIRMIQGEAVSVIYARGRRHIACTPSNRVGMDTIDGMPITMLTENKANPIIFISVYGDLQAVMFANGTVEIGSFAGTKPYKIFAFEHMVLPAANFIKSGEQRVATTADMVVSLSQNGVLYVFNLNQLDK